MWISVKFFYHSIMSLTHLIHPENIRKPELFLCFQGVSREISGMKWVKNPYLLLGSKFYLYQEPIHHWLLTLTLHGQVTLVARCDSSQTSVGVNYNLQRQLTVHTMCNPGLNLLLSEYLLQTMANEKKAKSISLQ